MEGRTLKNGFVEAIMEYTEAVLERTYDQNLIIPQNEDLANE